MISIRSKSGSFLNALMTSSSEARSMSETLIIEPMKRAPEWITPNLVSGNARSSSFNFLRVCSLALRSGNARSSLRRSVAGYFAICVCLPPSIDAAEGLA